MITTESLIVCVLRLEIVFLFLAFLWMFGMEFNVILWMYPTHPHVLFCARGLECFGMYPKTVPFAAAVDYGLSGGCRQQAIQMT